mgnify:CR=1 FL=1
MRYTVVVELPDDDTLHYESHTFMRMKGREELFDHVDQNTLKRVG